jgi:sugar lactone lactonase YvrE
MIAFQSVALLFPMAAVFAQPGIPIGVVRKAHPHPGTNSPDSPLNRPVLGYVVFSSPAEVRGILGVPGAAIFSPPLLLPKDVTRVRVAPGQSYALIERDQQETAVLPLDGAKVGAALSVTGALRVADFVAFSPSGRSAVLLSSAVARLQVITGLPERPQILQDIDLASLPELPDGVAISDDAGSILLESSHTVYLLSPDGSTRIAAAVTDSAALAFLPNSGNAAIGDRKAGSVYVIQPVTGRIVGVLSSGLDAIGEITPSSDGAVVYVTDLSGQHIRSVSVATGEVRTFELPVSPVRIDRLKNADTFLISAEPGQPAWIFLGSGNDARTVFVPAEQAVQCQSRE